MGDLCFSVQKGHLWHHECCFAGVQEVGNVILRMGFCNEPI